MLAAEIAGSIHVGILVTVQTAIMASMVWIVTAGAGYRIPARWVRRLWRLVFVRLAIPWVPAWPATWMKPLPPVAQHIGDKLLSVFKISPRHPGG